eukprot:CAMPEP_0119271188 /NCGR_PEP_ID=MMETSP1329-20130426/7881_1 /TAXON_ID=114041 /ORGANISM="Genus nov. species nov., Strain RCC1024" /LENGTH=118 /DNA_ID=CAMNT_0007271231 /DNA_START=34 /DNA_END=387 /DNA_ORIENTATION=+
MKTAPPGPPGCPGRSDPAAAARPCAARPPRRAARARASGPGAASSAAAAGAPGRWLRPRAAGSASPSAVLLRAEARRVPLQRGRDGLDAALAADCAQARPLAVVAPAHAREHAGAERA